MLFFGLVFILLHQQPDNVRSAGVVVQGSTVCRGTMSSKRKLTFCMPWTIDPGAPLPLRRWTDFVPIQAVAGMAILLIVVPYCIFFQRWLKHIFRVVSIAARGEMGGRVGGRERKEGGGGG